MRCVVAIGSLSIYCVGGGRAFAVTAIVFMIWSLKRYNHNKTDKK